MHLPVLATVAKLPFVSYRNLSRAVALKNLERGMFDHLSRTVLVWNARGPQHLGVYSTSTLPEARKLASAVEKGAFEMIASQVV